MIIPHLADPFYHAHRLASLGVVPPGIRISNRTGARLGQAIKAALALPAGPREAMAERLRRGDGLARAIAGIERLATTRRGVSAMQKAKGDSRVSVPLDRRYRKEKT